MKIELRDNEQWFLLDESGKTICICFTKEQADDILFALDRLYDIPDPER